MPFGHASSPQVYRLQGSPLALTGFFSPPAAPNRYPNLRPKGRTERRALWLPAASMHMTNLSCTSKTKKAPRCTGRLHACAPHAVGLCGLLHAPGSVAYAHSPRSCVLTPGHALGPSSVSPASHPRRRLGHTQSRKRQGHDVVRTNRIPHHVSKTIATHPLPARDERMIVVLAGESRTKDEHLSIIFLRNRKRTSP